MISKYGVPRLARRTLLLGMLLLLPASAPTVSGQTGSSVEGVVLDASGGVLPGVTVTLTASTDPAHSLVQVTELDGAFRFTDVPAGNYSYSLQASLPGFEDALIDPVTVRVESSGFLKIVLELGKRAETVLVTAVAAVIDAAAPAGDATVNDTILSAVPLAKDRFEDALPLLPGTIRGPDGLLNMNGTRADQSTLLVNGVNATDPVTGHFAVRLPLDAVDALNVHTGVYSAAFGSATGGVTNVITRAGGDAWRLQFQNFFPRFRFTEGGVRGLDAVTPRLNFSGPIHPGRFWVSQAFNYRFVRSRVDELHPLDASEQKLQSFDSLTQLDYAIRPEHRLALTFAWFPSNIDNVGIDTLHPFEATPDLRQRGWNVAVSARSTLNQATTLDSSVGIRQFDVEILPKRQAPSLVTVTGARGTYFNQFDRDSRRYDAASTLTSVVSDRWGDHLLKAGGQLAHTNFDGTDISLPVVVRHADGTPARRIDFLGDPGVGASNTDVAAFLDDQWWLVPRLTLNLGVRYEYGGIASEHTFAPRVEMSVRPLSHDRTIVKGGVGRFYDKTPLNAKDFERHQRRRITELDADGRDFSAAPVVLENRLAAGGVRTPRSTAWNVQLDQLLATDLTLRVGYRQRRGSKELVVDPLADVLLLSNHGRSRSHEFEATVHRRFGTTTELTASYVRAGTKGNLNDFVSLFGDVRDPIIRPDEYSLQPFDVPNRFLIWGVVLIPHKVTVAPTIEYRDGFPYSLLDHDQQFVGARNRGGRFPDLFTLDLAVTKEVHLTERQRARVGLQFFNLTGHFNARDVQNNISSPIFRELANSADRQVRLKFVLLF